MSFDYKVMEKIQDIDLSNVKEKLKYKKGWFWSWWNNVDKIEKDYKKFLYLIVTNPGQTIVPWNQNLDDLWHEHILDTIKYSNDCKSINGAFINHNPHLPKGSQDHKKSFGLTKEKYKEAFDKPKSGSSSSSDGGGCGGFVGFFGCGGSSPSCSSCSSGSSCSSASCGSSCGSSCGGGCGGGCGS